MNTLVIGYGNSLRGDDGVGSLVAEQVAEWNLPEVRSLAVHQLTPELAAAVAEAKTVFFVDACVMGEGQTQARLETIAPQPGRSRMDHLWSPSVLLSLAQTLYDANPVAYQIFIPALQFDYGAPLSAIAREGLAWSLETLKGYFNHPLSPSGTSVYTHLDLDTKTLPDPPQSPLKRGTSDPVPSFLRRVREDQAQRWLDSITCVYTVAPRTGEWLKPGSHPFLPRLMH